MSLYLGTTPIAVNSSSRNIGEIIQSTLPLTDAGLHLLDGSLISSGSYSAFVTYIAGLVSSYPDLFTTEANWQSSVSTYGVCGKFVYDSVNGTVRLPKITGFTEGTIDPTTLGDLTQAGLPNIYTEIATRKFESGVGTVASVTGAGTFNNDGYPAASNVYTFNNGTSNYPLQKTTIDASVGNSIYGNSSTVQPQSIKVLYYVCIATATKTQIEVDIDEIATDLNGKADVDLTNINAQGTSLASGFAMPSSTYDTLTLGASGTEYTAPANGWFCIDYSITSNNSYAGLNIDGYAFVMNGYQQWNAPFMFPCKKGGKIKVNYVNAIASLFRFYYAQGEV